MPHAHATLVQRIVRITAWTEVLQVMVAIGVSGALVVIWWRRRRAHRAAAAADA